MDVAYALIGFALGLTVAAVIVMIKRVITIVWGIAFYPLLYNRYQIVSSQLPANSSIQTTVSNAFQNSIIYVQQASNYTAVAVNTLTSVLQIIAFIGSFIIILDILMRLAMPRTEVVPVGY